MYVTVHTYFDKPLGKALVFSPTLYNRSKKQVGFQSQSGEVGSHALNNTFAIVASDTHVRPAKSLETSLL